jgi:hypothetical protein
MTYLFPEVKPRLAADRMALRARREEVLRRTDPVIAFEARQDDVIRRCKKRDKTPPAKFLKSHAQPSPYKR